ncbi:MAG TPA: hypothetical protein DCL63_04215, partial [Firmicutes bacterium]|nr:hypothetical protein [Bacillota bacterium]
MILASRRGGIGYMARSCRRLCVLVAVFTVAAILALTACDGVRASSPTQQEMMGGWQCCPEAYHPSRVIVRFAGNTMTTAAATGTIRSLGYSLQSTVGFQPSASFPSGLMIGSVDIPEHEDIDAAMARLKSLPGIMYVERDAVFYPDVYSTDEAPVIPNDPLFEAMWGLHNHNLPGRYWDPLFDDEEDQCPINDSDIDMPEAWTIFTGSRDVIVAVTDTGCYIDHPDLAGNIWTNLGEIPGNGIDDDGNGFVDDVHGWDFFHEDNTVFDRTDRSPIDNSLSDCHGTHVAGTIGACSNNGLGVTGINWDVQIMPLKFIGAEGGHTFGAIRAIEYAANNGASLINASWGGGSYSQALKDAIEASGILFIAAAGNAGDDNDANPHYPGSYDLENIITVAASSQEDWPCDYRGVWKTNYGRTTVDLFAPGGFILSTIPPDPPPGPDEEPRAAYAYMWGTSMATPHVTGVAALLAGKYPYIPGYVGAPGSAGGANLKDIILGTVDKKPWQFEGWVLTAGRLNAARALSAAAGPVITSAEASPHQGEPPLEVAFSAAAVSGEEITDMWWDFGDGSAPVHGYEASHTYAELGQYNAVFHAVDAGGLEATATVQIRVSFEPKIGVSPSSLESAKLTWGEIDSGQFSITNTGPANLDYSVGFEFAGFDPSGGEAPSGLPFAIGSDKVGVASADVGTLRVGGPDRHGYVWADSNQPGGPAFEWKDISEIGTRVDMWFKGWTANEEVAVDLPFEFPFYGEMKNQVRVSLHGYLTFGADGKNKSPVHVPDPRQPNDMLAPAWMQGLSGTVYYYVDDQTFIAQWANVWAPGSYDGPHTFQVVLTSEGGIAYQYLSMHNEGYNAGDGMSHVIGIENADGTDGLEVAYNIRDYFPYGHDGYAVIFVPAWIAANPSEGTLAPGGSQTIDVAFLPNKLATGDWRANLVVRSNDQDNPEARVATLTHVKSVIAPVVTLDADPVIGSAPLVVHFTATTYDRDGEIADYVWNFGDRSDPLRGTLTPIHAYAEEGEYDATLTSTDNEGLSTTKTVH